jgi:hypothetical protein
MFSVSIAQLRFDFDAAALFIATRFRGNSHFAMRVLYFALGGLQ